MKQYTIEIIITEGNDEFWEDINNKNSTGCEEVLDFIESCFSDIGYYSNTENFKIKLKEFKDI